MTAAAQKSPLPAVGDLLAQKYRIKRMLGAGGMGAVYMAHDESLGRDVAIKVLLPETSTDKDSVVRFLNEARSSARLRNEHVPQVYEINKLDNGSAYIVLEFLEGHDLGAVQKGWGTFPVHVAVDFIIQALEGIAAAHAMGIVHRDLKPANLFLTKHPDGTDCIKVLDFGISKTNDLAKSMGSDDGVTKTKALLGSPSYMAPEQFKNAKGVDHRADIWSIGVILYKLLTNQKPFLGDTPFELFEAVTQSTAISPRSYRAEIPEGLEAAIYRCFARNPAERFQNCAELAVALAPFAPHAQTSVDRICRTLQVTPNRTGQYSQLSALARPAVPVSPGDGSVSRSHVSQMGSYSNATPGQPGFGSNPSVSYSQNASISQSQNAASISHSQNASISHSQSLSQSQSQSLGQDAAAGVPQGSKRGPLIAVVVVLGLLVVGGGAFAAKLALDKKGAEGPEPVPSATQAATTPTTPPTTPSAEPTQAHTAAPVDSTIEVPTPVPTATSTATSIDSLPTARPTATATSAPTAKPTSTSTSHGPKPKPTASGDDVLKMRR